MFARAAGYLSLLVGWSLLTTGGAARAHKLDALFAEKAPSLRLRISRLCAPFDNHFSKEHSTLSREQVCLRTFHCIFSENNGYTPPHPNKCRGTPRHPVPESRYKIFSRRKDDGRFFFQNDVLVLELCVVGEEEIMPIGRLIY